MMRNGQNKRMRGRNRNNNNNNNHSHNQNRSHHHHNPLTRVYESNGPDVKIRGTAHHIAEKYLQLARDATSVGDHVTAEAHHQHAEHYLRLIAAAQEQFRQQNPHYTPPPAQTEENRDGASFEGGDDSSQPAQGSQNFSAQPNFQPQQQPQPYGSGPQPQSYGGAQQQPQPHYSRPQQQPSQQPQPPQHQPQPQQAQPNAGGNDVGGLPSFITGGQPPQQQIGSNGHDNQGDRFNRRRRRHRGPHTPGQDVRGGEGPDDSRPGND